jgi:hypothetical protein
MQELINRQGKIRINKSLLFSMDEETLKCFFSEFYPIAITHGYGNGAWIDYTCVSKRFDIVEEWQDLTPYYEITFKQTDNLHFIIEEVKKTS